MVRILRSLRSLRSGSHGQVFEERIILAGLTSLLQQLLHPIWSLPSPSHSRTRWAHLGSTILARPSEKGDFLRRLLENGGLDGRSGLEHWRTGRRLAGSRRRSYLAGAPSKCPLLRPAKPSTCAKPYLCNAPIRLANTILAQM